MTVDTVVPAIALGTYRSESPWFVPLSDDMTTASEEMNVQLRGMLIERLIDLSTREDSLDWDALARIDIDGWGADEEPA